MNELIRNSFQAFEQETRLSCARLRHIVPLSVYSELLAGFGGRKLYGGLILPFTQLQNTLSTSDKLNAAAVKHLMDQRTNRMKQDTENVSKEVYGFLNQHQINTDLHAYLIAETILVLRQAITLPSLLTSSFEAKYFEDQAVFGEFHQSLRRYQQLFPPYMEHLRETFVEISPDARIEQTEVWQRAKKELDLSASILGQHLMATTPVEPEASRSVMKQLVATVHFTNVPYLFLDILRAQGHSGKVTDGPNDGSVDVETTYNNQMYLTQVKCWRSPPIGQEQIRQFAQTCKTHGCSNGYYVTTFRFSRGAENGQWPQAKYWDHVHQNDPLVSLDKIANIELVDMPRLVDLVLQHKVGITASGFVQIDYWASMKIPGKRKEGDVKGA